MKNSVCIFTLKRKLLSFKSEIFNKSVTYMTDFPQRTQLKFYEAKPLRERATFVAITIASLRDSIVRFDACNMVPLHLYTTPHGRCHVILKGPSCVSGSLSPIALAAWSRVGTRVSVYLYVCETCIASR